MNCWHCKGPLIWGGDDDCDESDEWDMETNLSCPNCHSLVLVYYSEDSDEQL